MDKKLLITCLATGLVTTVLSVGLFYSGIFIFTLLGIILIPGFLFGLAVTNHYKEISSRQKTLFISISTLVYIVCALTTFYLSGSTSNISIVLFSTFSLPLITLLFNNFIKKLKNIQASLLIGALGGFLTGIIMFSILYFVDEKVQGESGSALLILSNLLIFPIWQTFFALTIKVDCNV